MNKSQVSFTPGPWHGLVDGRYDHQKNEWSVDHESAAATEYAPICGSDGTVIALVVHAQDHYYSGSHPLIDANARLIAAAPELLAALYEARDRMLGNSPAIAALRAKTDAAIAKATGGAA